MSSKDRWAGISHKRPSALIDSASRHHEIHVRDGIHMMKFPWGQELPAHESEIHFWQLLQDTTMLLEDPFLNEWIEGQSLSSDSQRAIREFVEHVKFTSSEATRIRQERRTQEIREVRISSGLDPETGKEIEDDKE